MAGILFVLITPAPDELPSTGPHSLDKVFLAILSYFSPLSAEVLGGTQMPSALLSPPSRDNLLSLTCVLLC
jgi:hypothetical protein